MIYCIYSALPNFPATDQAPGALRAKIGQWWVDYAGILPTLTEIQAIINPVRTVDDDLRAMTFNNKVISALVTLFTEPQQGPSRIAAMKTLQAARTRIDATIAGRTPDDKE